MTYESTLDWLYKLDAKLGMDFRIERLLPVLDRLGNPQIEFPSIHVAGTNGKGSTAAMLHSIYSQAGYRTGLYTSPHLLSFRERIRVGSRMISERDVVARAGEVQDAMTAAGAQLTFFEITTLMAFLEFRASELDVAVVEVGLGGRLDATNVVDSIATVITSIGLDHCAQLGPTIADIASEKAGILARDVPLVSGDLPLEALEPISEAVVRAGASWRRYGVDFGPEPPAGAGLLGRHQRRNAAVASAVVGALAERLPVGAEDLERGLAATRWPGRFEILGQSPRIVVDGAHNPEAASCLREAVESLLGDVPKTLVFGALRDKDWREMLCRLLPVFERVVLVPIDQSRSYDPAEACELVRGLRPFDVAASAAEGLDLAVRAATNGAGAGGTAGTENADGVVVVTGSIFLVAELYVRCGGADNPFVDATTP